MGTVTTKTKYSSTLGKNMFTSKFKNNKTGSNTKTRVFLVGILFKND